MAQSPMLQFLTGFLLVKQKHKNNSELFVKNVTTVLNSILENENIFIFCCCMPLEALLQCHNDHQSCDVKKHSALRYQSARKVFLKLRVI